MRLDAVLLQARVDPQLVARSRAAPRRCEICRVSPSRPRTSHSAVSGSGPGTMSSAGRRRRQLDERARRAHPVQRLVGAVVGVHRDRAVRLDQDEPGGHRQVGGEPTGVVDLAAGDHQTHRDNLPAPAPAADRCARGRLALWRSADGRVWWGSGAMGSGIAEVFARGGWSVVGLEEQPAALDRARQRLATSTARAVERGKLDDAGRAGPDGAGQLRHRRGRRWPTATSSSRPSPRSPPSSGPSSPGWTPWCGPTPCWPPTPRRCR